MAVVVKYIVVRDGDEKMTFATKKEADAYDKMLDIADNLFDFLGHSKIKIDETRKEEISLLLAEKRDEVMPILRGVSPKAKVSRKKGTPASGTAKSSAKTAAKQGGTAGSGTEPASRSAAKTTPRAKVAASKKGAPVG